MAEQEKEFQSPKYIFHSFMERLWAYLTIQQMLEQMWVARTPDGPLGQPHTARAPSQAFPCGGGWGATGSAGTGHLPGIERGGGGILGKLQTLPVGTSQKGLEGRESPSIRGGPAEPLTSPTCRVSASATEKQALETRALNLSLHYCFVTPLTSMVVTKPDGGERSEVAEKPMETNRGESRTPASLAAHF